VLTACGGEGSAPVREPSGGDFGSSSSLIEGGQDGDAGGSDASGSGAGAGRAASGGAGSMNGSGSAGAAGKNNGSGGSAGGVGGTTAGAGGRGGAGGATAGAGGRGGAGGATAGAGGRGGSGGATGGAGSGSTAGGGSGGSGQGGGGSSGLSYSTNFDLAEFPISEGGVWKHTGLDWTRVKTAGGYAFGTQTGSSGNGGYDDSYAYLSGFGPNQTASAVIHKEDGIASCCHEVEILLRWSDSDHDAHGYECNLAYDGAYAQIVRWNGAVGSFTYIGAQGSVPGGVKDGDTLTCTIVGDTITLAVNGVERAKGSDTTFTSGNPGIGFFRRNHSNAESDFGFTSFVAKALP
jgi:hypothetical protein